jgi:hypothetical protein
MLASDTDYSEIYSNARGRLLLYLQLKISLLSNLAAVLFDYSSTLKMEARTSCLALIIAVFWDMTP